MNTVAIVSPREIATAGLASLVERLGYRVSGRWSDLDSARRKLDVSPPDVLVVDSAAAATVPQAGLPLTGVPVVITVDAGERLTGELLRQLPVKGILHGNASFSKIEACLRTVLNGDFWIDPDLQLSAGTSGERPAMSWGRLSTRELEIANLAAKGLSNKRIAKLLDLSDGTIKIHMHHIFGKLHVTNRSELTSIGGLEPVS